jgi:hypothetical protein
VRARIRVVLRGLERSKSASLCVPLTGTSGMVLGIHCEGSGVVAEVDRGGVSAEGLEFVRSHEPASGFEVVELL